MPKPWKVYMVHGKDFLLPLNLGASSLGFFKRMSKQKRLSINYSLVHFEYRYKDKSFDLITEGKLLSVC